MPTITPLKQQAAPHQWFIGRFSVCRPTDSLVRRAGSMAMSVAVSLIFFGVHSPVRSETIQLRPSADTTLFQHNADNNLGAVDSLAVGGIATGPLARALVKFDVAASLSAQVTVTSVRFAFEVVKVPTSGGRPSDFRLHRLMQPWTEGMKAGGPLGMAATEGESTWNYRAHPTFRWSQPGGAAPVDFAATPSAAARITGVGRYEIVSAQDLVADVQAWLTNPASNFGWILISQGERTPETARRIGAREAGERAPVLLIDYTTGSASPPRIDRFEIVTNGFRLHFTAEAGRPYKVEFSETLAPNAWTTLTNLPSPVVSTNVVVSDAANRPQRTYRLRSP